AAAGGHIFVTGDEGASWTQRDLPGAVAGKAVKFIKVFPKDKRRAIAVVSEFTNGAGNIFHTTNLGKTWTSISGNLPDLPIWAAQFQGDSISTIYVGADNGVYKTTDTGASWSRFGTGLPNVQVFDMQLDTDLGILAIGTFGRGAWEIKLPPPTTTTVDRQQGKV